MRHILIRLGKTMIWIGRILLLLLFVLLFLQTCNTDIKKLGNNITYDDDGKMIFGKVDIPPTILSYDYDKQFIIVKQKPRKYPNAGNSDRGIYPSGRDAVYYWLIIKAEQKVLGPLDFEKFKEHRKNMEFLMNYFWNDGFFGTLHDE